MAEILIFGILALAVIASALGVILSRNAVVAVLMLVSNFLVVAVIYLALGAPFIALSQITVYAGAIMILFLFVIMMLGADKLRTEEPHWYLRVEVTLLAVAFVGLMVWLLVRYLSNMPPLPEHLGGLGDPVMLGTLLYTRYTMPVVAISILLLVAAVGAVVLTKPDPARRRSREDKP